jgi:hypothetical protein
VCSSSVVQQHAGQGKPPCCSGLLLAKQHGSELEKPQAAYFMLHVFEWCCNLVACTNTVQTKVAISRHGSVALALLCLFAAAVGL